MCILLSLGCSRNISYFKSVDDLVQIFPILADFLSACSVDCWERGAESPSGSFSSVSFAVCILKLHRQVHGYGGRLPLLETSLSHPNAPLYSWKCFWFQRMLIVSVVVVLARYQPVCFQITSLLSPSLGGTSNLCFHSAALSLSAFAKLLSAMSLRLVCVHLQNKNHPNLGSPLS